MPLIWQLVASSNHRLPQCHVIRTTYYTVYYEQCSMYYMLYYVQCSMVCTIRCTMYNVVCTICYTMCNVVWYVL